MQINHIIHHYISKNKRPNLSQVGLRVSICISTIAPITWEIVRDTKLRSRIVA